MRLILILKISTCHSSIVHTKAVEWIARQGLKLYASTICLEESARRVQSISGIQAAVDRVRRVAVEDLVLNQEDEPKRYRSAREISHETAILHSSMHRIIHYDLQLKCFKRRRAQLLSEANRISRLTRW